MARRPVSVLLVFVALCSAAAAAGDEGVSSSQRFELKRVAPAEAAVALRAIVGARDFKLLDGAVLVRDSAENLELVANLFSMLDSSGGVSEFEAGPGDLVARFALSHRQPGEVMGHLRDIVGPQRILVSQDPPLFIIRDTPKQIHAAGLLLALLDRDCILEQPE